MAKTPTPADLEALDRLEEKVKLLVATIGRLHTERDRLAETNRQLTADLEAARARIQETESGMAEASVLRQERDQVRARVAEMLEQLESLNL